MASHDDDPNKQSELIDAAISRSEPENQSIDCELVNKANADEFGVFARKS